MKNQHIRNLIELSFATLFISASGVLGKFIDMPTTVIIWWRAALALVVLFLFCRYKNIKLKFYSNRDNMTSILSALFLGAHWVTYFYAIKLSNVSLGMLSLFTFPTITTLLEPLLTSTKFEKAHLLLGVMVLFGIYILVPEFNIDNSDVKGIAMGVFSALLFSLRNIILKVNTQKYDGTMLMMHQLLVVTIVLSPCLYFMDTSNINTQYPYIIMLAVISTALGHSLFVKSLKHFSASTASIIVSMQPIYGIIIAFFLLNIQPTINTCIGGALIISTVIIEGIRTNKSKESV
jgi:drug/metabolite transporter (DMT)-like permease